MADAPPNRDALIQQFCAFTGASPSDAEPVLTSHNWNVEDAVATWFASQEGQNEDLQDLEDAGSDAGMTGTQDPPPPQPQQPAEPTPPAGLVMGGGRTLGGSSVPSTSVPSSSRAAPSGSTSTAKSNTQRGKGGLRTLKDLQGGGDHEGHGHDDDDDSGEDQDFFAGGEKSGLAVQNPNAGPSNPHQQIDKILERARKNGPPANNDEPEQRPNRFGGRGVTLGGDDAPSQVIEDPTAATAAPTRLPRVRRVLHLWLEGFSVDDGPLYRYDDPANAQTLAMINNGHAPLELLNVQPSQEVDLELDNQKEHKFVQPKKKYVPFGGSGQRLGSPTPGVATSASTSATSSAPVAIPAAAPATSSSTANSIVDVNDAEPTITLQIRLGDGTRLQSRFNTTHTIGDVYSFVNAASAASSQRAYALMTTFPSKDLDDKNVQLGDMSEFKRGGVVVQKWK
ncbi:SEP-domain-containing protein [Tothia fuscella]|uniref:SEP-domain-containing protein n=1 Tax=Tothia fuscella TaxID=1048955 RepID=A0A9P4U3Q1_9PEZI|nr:SEP-domain-containing protein [Tothia fuscella]